MDDLEPNPFDERVAPTYDVGSAHMFEPHVLGPTVDLLQELAGDGPALELAIGTGRVALPLAARGVEVHGIDFSEAMVAELRRKPGGDRLPVTIGDMATTRVGSGFTLAYLVYNTVTNLLTPGRAGRVLPHRRRPARAGWVLRHRGLRAPAEADAARSDRGALPRREAARRLRHRRRREPALRVAPLRADRVLGARRRTRTRDVLRLRAPLRLAVGELDLMARIAGLRLRDRWADWDRTPFTADSESHVSVWTKVAD